MNAPLAIGAAAAAFLFGAPALAAPFGLRCTLLSPAKDYRQDLRLTLDEASRSGRYVRSTPDDDTYRVESPQLPAEFTPIEVRLIEERATYRIDRRTLEIEEVLPVSSLPANRGTCTITEPAGQSRF